MHSICQSKPLVQAVFLIEYLVIDGLVSISLSLQAH